MLEKSSIVNLSDIDYIETIAFVENIVSVLKYHPNFFSYWNWIRIKNSWTLFFKILYLHEKSNWL
jgi:hypothetical protein